MRHRVSPPDLPRASPIAYFSDRSSATALLPARNPRRSCFRRNHHCSSPVLLARAVTDRAGPGMTNVSFAGLTERKLDQWHAVVAKIHTAHRQTGSAHRTRHALI